MLAYMRIAVDINDALLHAAKSQAARERRPLQAIVEQALREFLSRPGRADASGPPIPVFRGQGVQPGVDLTDNAAIEALMNIEP